LTTFFPVFPFFLIFPGPIFPMGDTV
jgi:hypothetical protein